METRRFLPLNWAHLLLLAGLPAWLVATAPLPADARLGGWLTIGFVVLGIAERVQPHRIDWRPGARALRRDGSVLALNLVADALASLVLASVVARLAAGASTLPFGLQLLLGVGSGELVSYALHRASHRDGWLWRVHLLHHRPEQLNVANALTAHPINAIYDKLARALPMLALGLSGDAVVAVAAFSLTQNLAVHANVAGTLGPLNFVVGTAELHRLHHSTDERQAGNFGTAVPWWDLVFGTFRWRETPAHVGVFDRSPYPGEHALLRLLAWPFCACARTAHCCR